MNVEYFVQQYLEAFYNGEEDEMLGVVSAAIIYYDQA